jgi:hypothetical protein
LGVRCLRWPEQQALYVCASEPADPFSLGVSSDEGGSFRALYRLTDTCPASCAMGTSFAASCQAAWSQTRPFIQASGAMCSVPWSAPTRTDAGWDDASAPPTMSSADVDSGPNRSLDASSVLTDAALTAEPRANASGCDCQISCASGSRPYVGALAMMLLALGLACRRHERGTRSTRRSG